MQSIPDLAIPEPKPRYRGVFHQFGAAVAVVAVATLIASAPTTRAIWATVIYGVSLVTLLTISAAYHRVAWEPPAELLMRRLDHSAIFVLIAGTYTPICLLVLGPSAGVALLLIAWGCAILGVLQANFWPYAPSLVRSFVYVAFGCLLITEWRALTTALTTYELVCIGVGGACYILGALIYATERPDPLPKIFGFHEVFHTLVVIAAALHFAAIYAIVVSS